MAGFQIVLGYAWLVAGADKMLLARFPSMLGMLLTGAIHGGMIPAPFASFLERVVVPNGGIFGAVTEWGELLTGLGLIVAGLTTLLAGPLRHRLPGHGAVLVTLVQCLLNVLAPVAALGGLIMGLSFYLVDGAPSQGFVPSTAFGGALDEAFLLALGSLVLLTAAIVPWVQRISGANHLKSTAAREYPHDAQRPFTDSERETSKA